MTVPKIIFIIPYRNREPQKCFFINYFNIIMEDWNKNDYELVFSHQCDSRAFNRGGTKNIGFLAMKKKYPNNYKDITFIYHDIDVMPYCKNLIPYITTNGFVKHFYGYDYALGGIISLTGHDFELLNGFPNYWGWGLEDNCLQKRCNKKNINIDRKVFFNIGDKKILHLYDDKNKLYCDKNVNRYTEDHGIDGIKSITKLNYKIEDVTYNNINYTMVNIYSFEGIFKHLNSEIRNRSVLEGNNLNIKRYTKRYQMASIFNVTK